MFANLKTHHRLASAGLSSALLLGAALAGCTEPEGARFAEASDAQLERVYRAAAAHDLVSVLILGAVLSGGHQPTGCPRIVTEGQDTTVTGGCTLTNGARLDGSIELHNMFGYEDDPPSYDPSQPSTMELAFRISFPQGGEHALDGRLELFEEGGRFSSDLTIDTAGIASTSRIAATCQDPGPCTLSPGSEIEISGLGRAAVEGSWSFIDPPAGELTVRGADVLVFDISSLDGNCVPYTVGDERGTVCTRDPDVDDWLEPPAAGTAEGAAQAITVEDDWESP